MTFLEDIIAKKKIEIEDTKKRISFAQMKLAAENSARTRDFRQAIHQNQITCIAEIKRASPSRGVLTEDFIPKTIAQEYSAGGASAVSVLTEREYFRGYPEAIREVKETCGLPVLRKDFIIDEYQIDESRVLGADAILLIVNILDAASIVRFLHRAHTLGMDCLVECHSEDEVVKAVDAGAEIIGINNRDLHTFDVSLETSFKLRKQIPKGRVCVSESGIRTHDHIKELSQAGFHAVLVGEQLITAADRTGALRSLLRG